MLQKEISSNLNLIYSSILDIKSSEMCSRKYGVLTGIPVCVQSHKTVDSWSYGNMDPITIIVILIYNKTRL